MPCGRAMGERGSYNSQIELPSLWKCCSKGGCGCSVGPNTPIYLPERVQNFWCFEFLPSTNHEFAIHPEGDVFHTADHTTRKTSKLNKLLTTKADDDLWHERMCHAGSNTLKHLPDAVLGDITITKTPVTLECALVP